MGQPTVVFSDPTITMTVVGLLVAKLGGKVTVTQADVDAIAYAQLLEHGHPDGSIELEVRYPNAQG